MIQNDGGKGEILIDYPAKLGIWETLSKGTFDATWIFMNWEGIEAEKLDTQLRYFAMHDFDIPYSYSPLIAASESEINERESDFRSFIAATRKGFNYCQENPEEAVSLLQPFVPEKDQKINLNKALKLSITAFGKKADWGLMNEKNVEKFLNWIYDQKLESKQLKVSELITNQLLK